MTNHPIPEYIPTTEELQAELNDVVCALRRAYTSFDYVTDPELVEACIHEIDALRARHSYLLRCIKSRNRSASERCIAASAVKGGQICPS